MREYFIFDERNVWILALVENFAIKVTTYVCTNQLILHSQPILFVNARVTKQVWVMYNFDH